MFVKLNAFNTEFADVVVDISGIFANCVSISSSFSQQSILEEYPCEEIDVFADVIVEVINSPVRFLYCTESSTYDSAILADLQAPCRFRVSIVAPVLAKIVADVLRNE